MNNFVGSISSLNLVQNCNVNNSSSATLMGHENEPSNEIINIVDTTPQSFGLLSASLNETENQFDKRADSNGQKRARSVVVSNIGKDVSADYLTD
ncbi:hypothetical protein Bhyg_08010 [Pseudolycoriella hygida]|uniref:Uncharacterized protein n=1 Tax=Pseudolycoriella hygida TaxID=35572 RepID=A0A9Q0N3V9_9DIPT|nr:hypothetical protein Bhyg_08009 [Pseudolycoriella hygida]KAJ6643054.1 hypothetical protein Bhyg_08010 [Pseudolycoriella hygida]